MSVFNSETELDGTVLDELNKHVSKYIAFIGLLTLSKVLDAVSTVFALSTVETAVESRAVARTMLDTFGLITGSALTIPVSIVVFVGWAFFIERLFDALSEPFGTTVPRDFYPYAVYLAPIVWNTYLALSNTMIAL